MNIFIMNCHTANRGDEAAVRALVDEMILIYPDISILLGMRGPTRYPNLPINVTTINQIIIGGKFDYKFQIAKLTHGRVTIGRTYTKFVNAIKSADIILHAPGGPSIGDTYFEAEVSYLYVYDLVKSIGKPYMFYAPSMGPFNITERNEWRKRILSDAEAIVLRDPISAEYVRELLPEKNIYQTLDSALQHEINYSENEKKLNDYIELKEFLKSHDKVVGITITDLLWHPIYSKNKEIACQITESFSVFLKNLVSKGYGIVYIPQLYGTENDFDLMNSFVFNSQDYYIIPDNEDCYDTYFQQFLIGKLYAVIGMRYHSNIFSAKMGTPFVSVSYEQKMKGFMKKMELDKYCLPLEELSAEVLTAKFNYLHEDYDTYKNMLVEKHNHIRDEAYKTTLFVKEIIDSIKPIS